jgi:hypothetical protein
LIGGGRVNRAVTWLILNLVIGGYFLLMVILVNYVKAISGISNILNEIEYDFFRASHT